LTFNYEIAVAGCGYWGANLVRVFNQLGVLSLVCEQAAKESLALPIYPELTPPMIERVVSCIQDFYQGAARLLPLK
jgi:dTDP-4-amino-4,6-dideoxygalactose transaminase